MRVLDATFLIDYEAGETATKEYLQDHADDVFTIPSVVLEEFLLGDVHGTETTDLAAARELFSWAEIHPVSTETVVAGARVADAIGPQGPLLSTMDAIVAGTGRELNAHVVSGDSDLTHDETKLVLDVEEYR